MIRNENVYISPIETVTAIDSLKKMMKYDQQLTVLTWKKLNEARFRFPNFLLVFLLFLRSDRYYVMRIGVSKFWSDLLRGRCNEHNSINYFIKFHLNSYLVFGRDEFELKFPKLTWAELKSCQAESCRAWALWFSSWNQAELKFFN